MRNKDVKQLDRRDFLALVGAGTVALLTKDLYAGTASAGSRKPNIVLILGDDLGYADLGVYGCKDMATPNLDRLAGNGVRFTDGYVSCPVCSPTRAGLMTGRYQERFGHWYNPGPPTQADANFGLPLSETTLADLLKKEGYATGLVGKWHLGYKPEYHPMKRGFDEFFGFLAGSHSYLDARADKANPILRGTEPVDEPEYLTDAFTREAVAFIERHKDGPFFLYLAYNAAHVPMQATQKYLDRFSKIGDEKRRTHAAQISALDDGVGAVVETLRKNAILEDTIVVFLSDNGGPTPQTTAANTPFSGVKGTLREGGIREPFIVQWPRRFPKGAVYRKPAISLDILPTCVAAAGGTAPSGLDGVDLIPYLTYGKRGEPHQVLFWRYREGSAIRTNKWKLAKDNQGRVALYDLAKDPGEARDVAEKHRRRVEEMGAQLAQWESELKPPLWGGKPAGLKRRPRRRGQGKRRRVNT